MTSDRRTCVITAWQSVTCAYFVLILHMHWVCHKHIKGLSKLQIGLWCSSKYITRFGCLCTRFCCSYSFLTYTWFMVCLNSWDLYESALYFGEVLFLSNLICNDFSPFLYGMVYFTFYVWCGDCLVLGYSFQPLFNDAAPVINFFPKKSIYLQFSTN